MWAVRPVFARNAEFGCRNVDALGQFRQLRSSVNSDPEYARSLRSRKKSISSSPNFERAAFDSPQAFGDGLDPLGQLFSDELQCNVQRLRTHPASFGREALDAFEETLDAGADFRVEIDADEYSHLLNISALHHRLQQRPADHLQRLLGCELADALTVAGKITLDDLRAFFSGECDINQADGFLLGAAARAGDSGDSDTIAREAAFADAFSHRGGHFADHPPPVIVDGPRNIFKLG